MEIYITNKVFEVGEFIGDVQFCIWRSRDRMLDMIPSTI